MEIQSAYELLDDGWVAQFIYRIASEGKEDIPYNSYSFTILNMRYRFNEEWDESVMVDRDRNGNVYYIVHHSISPTKSWFSINERRQADRAVLKELFGRRLMPEEMLELDPASFSFQELDGDLFFRLMKAALTDAQKTKKEAPARQQEYFFDMNVESDYQDGYKYQISYIEQFGYLERIVIDVLYRTGDAYNDYEQLSDLVQNGQADAAQQEAYGLILQIEEAITAQNSFTALQEEYGEKEIGGIDFYRLYTFLTDLETGDIYYGNASMLYWPELNTPREDEELSEEDFMKTHPDFVMPERSR